MVVVFCLAFDYHFSCHFCTYFCLKLQRYVMQTYPLTNEHTTINNQINEKWTQANETKIRKCDKKIPATKHFSMRSEYFFSALCSFIQRFIIPVFCMQVFVFQWICTAQIYLTDVCLRWIPKGRINWHIQKSWQKNMTKLTSTHIHTHIQKNLPHLWIWNFESLFTQTAEKHKSDKKWLLLWNSTNKPYILFTYTCSHIQMITDDPAMAMISVQWLPEFPTTHRAPETFTCNP